MKLLCCVDNTLVFVHSTTDLLRLQHHFETFSKAAKDKINFEKVQALSLPGKSTWDYWESSLTAMSITVLHDEDDAHLLANLGYPLL